MFVPCRRTPAHLRFIELDCVLLKNQEGAFVEPDATTFQAAGADWSKSFTKC
jgi:hypothetical protein